MSVEDPRTAPPLRWGVLGPGGIARTFARAVQGHTRGDVVAVGSRSRERALRFAEEFGVGRAYGSYPELVADPDVDAVYVASPHSGHHEHALLAVRAGKHVLVEKPFTRNEREAREVLDAAREQGVFVMEAMWTRFLPHVAALREVVGRGEIGEVLTVIADHGQALGDRPPDHRLHAPELAGGALLDLGVYPVAFAMDLLGEPDRVRAVGSLTPTGVDGQVSISLGFGERAQAALHTTLWAQTATTAVVVGTHGRIEVARQFYQPSSFTVVRLDGERWTWSRPVDGGFQYQIAEAARRIAAGDVQSPRMSHAHTLAVARVLDEVRRQVGVVYPGE